MSPVADSDVDRVVGSEFAEHFVRRCGRSCGWV